jgi:hypothetical protein
VTTSHDDGLPSPADPGDHLPQMFGTAPPMTCSRVGCGRSATFHVIWTAEMDNGLCCDDHMEEARRRWRCYAHHDYDPGFCSHPQASFEFSINKCVIPLEDVDWDAHVAAELPDQVSAKRRG